LPKLVVVLAGGFTTNFLWCIFLNLKNRTWSQYYASTVRIQAAPALDTSVRASHARERSEAILTQAERAATWETPIPRLGNYLFSALAGTTWYFQFFFYTMGETQMGKYSFASWTLHMASIIIFSTMWGWLLHEWKGSSRKTHGLIAAGIGLLILSTMIIGLGTYLKSR
jgi:L-rhamnose-H+ transport protein